MNIFSAMRTLSVGILTTALLSSCGVFKTELDKCYELREYQAAEPGARARVPDDLEPLTDEGWVPIPYGEGNEEATPKGDPCLIEPPEYRLPD
jgi:uncharacterized lipoprotein